MNYLTENWNFGCSEVIVFNYSWPSIEGENVLVGSENLCVFDHARNCTLMLALRLAHGRYRKYLPVHCTRVVQSSPLWLYLF